MSGKAKLLLAENSQELGDSLKVILEGAGYAVNFVTDGDFALDLVEEEEFDVIVTDLEMPTMSGLELLKGARKFKPEIPIIVITGHTSTERTIEATKLGAFDYLLKPLEIPELLDVVAKAIDHRQLTGTPIEEFDATSGDYPIIGSSKPMQEVFKQIGKIAYNPIPVLIHGETGTGKELIARAIHQYSNRANKPFIAVNCGAIPENLIESELFGHERGAFTGAVTKRIGRFEKAHGGTLFLDEIGDLPWKTQVKLLRVLQEKTMSRVGSSEQITVDIRIISATHRDLATMISAGLFREDLFFRLNAAQIMLPPLRERMKDVPAISDYLLAKYAREFEMPPPVVDPKARKLLVKQNWPGNVRELENVLRKSLIETKGKVISAEIVSRVIEEICPVLSPLAAQPEDSRDTLVSRLVASILQASDSDQLNGTGVLPHLNEEFEKEALRQAIELTHGNQSRMAALLGIARYTVREKLDKYDLLPKRKTAKTE